MSESIDDGGAAFPVVETDPNCGTRTWFGMSLRDYFAGQALAGYMAVPDDRVYRNDCGKSKEQWQSQLWADDAHLMYEMADAMLKARKTK